MAFVITLFVIVGHRSSVIVVDLRNHEMKIKIRVLILSHACEAYGTETSPQTAQLGVLVDIVVGGDRCCRYCGLSS